MLSLLSNLTAALQAITAFCKAAAALFEVAPEIIPLLTQRELNEIRAKIIALESAADPDNHDKLALLRIQEAGLRKCHEAVLAKLAPPQSGNGSTNK